LKAAAAKLGWFWRIEMGITAADVEAKTAEACERKFQILLDIETCRNVDHFARQISEALLIAAEAGLTYANLENFSHGQEGYFDEPFASLTFFAPSKEIGDAAVVQFWNSSESLGTFETGCNCVCKHCLDEQQIKSLQHAAKDSN
jgi:hypothetical protein